MIVTVFENIYSQKPFYIKADKALDRIRNGNSRMKIEAIRSALDKEKADALKRNLPSVCFSGKFGGARNDKDLIEHSGLLVLDFDNLGQETLRSRQEDFINLEYVYACWVSPRGNGLKVLVRIADGSKHREHFQALKDIFPDVDGSGINQSRVCYESYDPELMLNADAKPFTKIKTVEVYETTESIREEREVFTRLLKWLSNRNDAFVTGERNLFIFKLASACSRFGINEHAAARLILSEYPASNDFTHGEALKAVKSAFRSGRAKYATATFERDVLVEKTTRKEIVIDAAIYDETIRPRDVVYGADVKPNAIDLYARGHASVKGLGIPIDAFFKAKRMELTGLTGIGNYGKSSFWKWFMLMRVLAFGEKFASFSPEDNPPEEYYMDFVEMLLGCDCTPQNSNRPNIEVFSNAYDFISRHIFYLYPVDASPTPDYVKERFLELIVKEKVDGVVIDPWNQMSHDYGKAGGARDKYLENVLGDLSRFAQANNVYFTIIMHPNKMQKDQGGNYPCPDLFDINDGAMWNCKLDNLLVYHRPLMQKAPEDPTAEFHSKKIRRQKIVGKKGLLCFEYIRKSRRFEFSGVDYMKKLIEERGLSFKKEQAAISFSMPAPYVNGRLNGMLASGEEPF